MGGRLHGKKAFVTGGASGIGAAIARRFVEEGAQVVVGDLVGGDVTVDVRASKSVEAAVRVAAERLGGLTTLVCNAGRPVIGKLHELARDEWDDGLAVNLTGVYLTVKSAWPYLVESQGSIISTASIFGLWGAGGQGAYCAFKAGVVMLTKCLAIDGGPDGIRANCVCPGMTMTPMMEGILAQQRDPDAALAAAVSYHPIGRLGSPVDIADAFVYLASDEAAWVTGHALVVDGGFTSGEEVSFE